MGRRAHRAVTLTVTSGPAVSPDTGLGIRCVAVGGMERLPYKAVPQLSPHTP